VAALALRTPRALEDRAATVATEAGWLARARIAHVDGQPLPCGEIDGLLLHRDDGQLLLAVCEVKDIDLPLGKTRWLAELTRKCETAWQQVSRKSSWVAQAWERVLAEQFAVEADSVRRLHVAGLVVTRRFLARLVQPRGARFLPIFRLGEILSSVGLSDSRSWLAAVRLNAAEVVTR
jgi:hypothetical protein